MLSEFAYRQSQGINALPRGGNTWPNNYAWDGYSDPEIQLYDKNKALRMPALGSTLGIGRRDTIEAPYIQYEANTDRDLGYPFDSPYQLVIPKWRFNNSKWLSFKDHRTNSSEIAYLPYTNEFVDEKMCSQYNKTNSAFRCNLSKKLYLHYPDKESRIFSTFDQLVIDTNGNYMPYFYDTICARTYLQLSYLDPSTFPMNFFSTVVNACISELHNNGKYEFWDLQLKPVRTLFLQCIIDPNQITITPIPINILRQGGTKGKSSLFEAKVYPNPTLQSVTVEIGDFDPQTRYTAIVEDIRGIRFKAFELNEQKSNLNLTEYPAGIYTLHIQSSDNSLTQKVKLCILK